MQVELQIVKKIDTVNNIHRVIINFLFVGADCNGLSTENFVGSWGCNFICYWFNLLYYNV